MVTLTVPGYPSPEPPSGENRDVFPYDAAAIVAEWAWRAGMHKKIVGLLDDVHDSQGDPDAVMRLAESWGPKANNHVLRAREGMQAARDNVKAYWEGSGYTAFSSYTDHVLKVIEDTSKVMESMSSLMLDVRTQLVESYNAGIKFIGDCAVALLEAAASIIQNIHNLFGAVCSAILTALSKFIGAMIELTTKCNVAMAELGKAGIRLKQRAVELRVPDPIPSSVGESGNWKVGRR